MKIGILSLKYECNYGGILQSYALQECLKELGHEVEVINFTRTRPESKMWIFFNRALSFLFSGKILSILKDRHLESTKKAGENSRELIENNEIFLKTFINRSILLDEVLLLDYCKKFDCIIVGSDQVWSVTMSSFLPYFLDWDFKGKRIAYSACTVNSQPALLNRLKIKKLIRKFDAISVRDDLTYRFVDITSGVKATITADPTLLCDFSKIPTNTIITGQYIFMYILGEEIDGGNENALKKIKTWLNLNIPIVSVVIPSNSLAGTEGADKIITNCAPDSWLSLIKNASFVFTDSFHGCVFSMKYKKPFIGYYKFEKRASRLLDLQKRYGLSNIINKSADISTALDCSSIVNTNAIEDHIKQSMDFLSRI